MTEARTGTGSHIRSARNAAGLTLEQVAGAIGISPATLSLMERDKVGVTPERLAVIARRLGVTVEQLSDGGVEANAAAEGGTRAQVMQAAIDCFVARGYHGTSMREIAQAGRVSVAGVYHYFDSKQALLVSISEYTMDRLLARLEAAAAQTLGLDAVEQFRTLVATLALFHIEERDLGFIGASERRSLEPENRGRIFALRRRAQELLDEAAFAAAAAGEFTTSDVKFAARNVANMCTSLAQWFNPAGQLSPDAAAARVADYAVAMMRS